jgi:hypothetical protein
MDNLADVPIQGQVQSRGAAFLSSNERPQCASARSSVLEAVRARGLDRTQTVAILGS